MMKRRKLVNYLAVAGGATLGMAACSTDRSAELTSDSTRDLVMPNVRWRMVTSWPQALDTIYGGAQTVCDRVSALTDGRFTIEPYAAGEIVPGLEVLDAVQAGAVECGHTASYYYVGKNPALAFGASVPFGLNAQQQNAWFYHGGGLALMQALYADFGVLTFPAGNTGVQMGGWFKRQINTLAELQGLKMRIPGIGGKVMAELGVNVQVLPGGEIFLALDRGAIDAAEFVGPYDDEKLGLADAAQFYYYPGWWEPGTTTELQVNRTAWDKLPKDYQEVLKTAAYEANINMLAKYDALNGMALKRLVDSGVQLTAYSNEILQAAQVASREILEADASSDATFKTIYQQWKQFRDSVSSWNQINELSFSQFVSQNKAIQALRSGQ